METEGHALELKFVDSWLVSLRARLACATACEFKRGACVTVGSLCFQRRDSKLRMTKLSSSRGSVNRSLCQVFCASVRASCDEWDQLGRIATVDICERIHWNVTGLCVIVDSLRARELRCHREQSGISMA